MAAARRVDDRVELERWLRRDVDLHIYELGDLDDFFFPRCAFFAADGAVALLYEGSDPPTLVALTRGAPAPMAALLRDIAPELPSAVYAHLTPGLEAALEPEFVVRSRERHQKMILADVERTRAVAADAVEVLGPEHLDEVLAFYREAYPDSWFVPRMLETGAYRAYREAGRIVAIAGVHVLSRVQRVAALGNVAAMPAFRGRGLARGLCAALCLDLLRDVGDIGLNVAADHAAAIACYRRAGFELVAPYHEVMLVRAS